MVVSLSGIPGTRTGSLEAIPKEHNVISSIEKEMMRRLPMIMASLEELNELMIRAVREASTST